MDCCIIPRINAQGTKNTVQLFFIKKNTHKDYLMTLTGSQTLIP